MASADLESIDNRSSVVRAIVLTAVAVAAWTLPATAGVAAYRPLAVSVAQSTTHAFPVSVASQGVPARITVILEDDFGSPVAGKTVSLTAGSGSSSITTVSATSDAEGHALFTVKDFAAETVQYTAHDTTDGIDLAHASVSYAVSSISFTNSSMVASPTSLAVHNSSSLSVTLKDGANNAVGSQAVGVTQDGPSAISPSSTFTDANGAALFAAADDRAEVATYYAEVNGVGVALVSVTFTPGPLDHLRLSPDIATVVGSDSEQYTATGLDQYGNEIADVTSSTTFTIAPDGSCTGASCS